MEKNKDENKSKLPCKTKKRYSQGASTERELKLIQKKQEIKDKWKKELLPEEKIIPKKGRRRERKIIVIDEQPEVHECCIKCDIWKPLYEFYLRGNFLDAKSTKELISNESTRPCIKCSKETRTEIFNNSPDGYITRLLNNYPKLDIKWYREKICEIGGLFSSILNVPLYESPNVDWRVSIQNNCPDLEHLPENCTIISFEENVQQHNAIPNLKLAFTSLFIGMLQEMKHPDTLESRNEFSKEWKKRFEMTPQQSGVQSKCRENGKMTKEYLKEYNVKHLRAMFIKDSNRTYTADKISKRDPPKKEERIYADDMFSIGEKQ